MQNIADVFDAVISFFCPIKNLSVNTDVMVAAVAEEYIYADVMFSCQICGDACKETNGKFMQYSVRMGLPPYFRRQALAWTPHSGAKSVAVDAKNPLFFNALKPEPKKRHGCSKRVQIHNSKRFFGEAKWASKTFASLRFMLILSCKLLSSMLYFASCRLARLCRQACSFYALTSATMRMPLMPCLLKVRKL